MTIKEVVDMLKNRRFIGEYRFRNIIKKDGIARIVTQDLLGLVQSEREKKKRATARYKAEDDYLLTTKLFCGKCNALMVGESMGDFTYFIFTLHFYIFSRIFWKVIGISDAFNAT